MSKNEKNTKRHAIEKKSRIEFREFNFLNSFSRNIFNESEFQWKPHKKVEITEWILVSSFLNKNLVTYFAVSQMALHVTDIFLFQFYNSFWYLIYSSRKSSFAVL